MESGTCPNVEYKDPELLRVQGKMGTSPMQVAMASNPEHNEGAVMGSFIGLVSAKFCRDQKRPADRGS